MRDQMLEHYAISCKGAIIVMGTRPWSTEEGLKERAERKAGGGGGGCYDCPQSRSAELQTLESR